jgi:hypothetical protein
MSNYYAKAIDPKTGKTETVEMLDNFYGRHSYGVRFPDGQTYGEGEVTFISEVMNG